MSAFSDHDFLADNYINYRPKYPPAFFQKLISYHTGPKRIAVDVGCGPGEATFPLVTYFDRVIGYDVSSVMIKQANSSRDYSLLNKVEFQIGSGESLPSKSNSIDLLTAAECVHWFNQEKFIQESYRVLRLGGTLAYWGYSDPVFIDYPDAWHIYESFAYLEPQYLGPYWELPGNDYLQDKYNHIELPPDLFTNIKRVEYEPGTRNREALILKKQYHGTSQLRQMCKTWSSYHLWKKTHPDSPDVIDLMFDQLKKSLHWNEQTVLNVEWITFYVFATKI